MSDSECDELVSRNGFAQQNERTIVSGAGPGVNFSNVGTSFRSTIMSSSRIPPLFENSRYAESSYIPRSGREVSPMSVRSVCDARQRNFNYSFNPHGMGNSRSVYNSRAGSPMSVRSIDTTASVSAVDIANAFKHEHFSKHDLKMIKEAYNRFVRHKVRKTIDKRRYRRVHRYRHRSGEDSGEQGSDSSVSSGDCSSRTRHNNVDMSSARSTITDISTFRRTIKDSNLFKDCTESLKHNMFQRKGPGSVNLNGTQTSIMSNRSTQSVCNMPVFKKPANFQNLQRSKNTSVMLQKERFTNGFLLPAHRFNNAGNTSMIPENVAHSNKNHQNELHPVMEKESRQNVDNDSEEDNIFPLRKPSSEVNGRKRSIGKVGDENVYMPNQKRQKTLSPCRNSIEAQEQKANSDNKDDNADDFIFTKPKFPVKKQVKEKLISKSAAPSLDNHVVASIDPPPVNMKPTKEQTKEKEEEASIATQNSTNMSIKRRKLFSQKLDVTEKRDLSTDSLDSPQDSIYAAIQKDRKTRKLQQATTQSCLNRDIQKDENSLLDLIQKIVPIDKMNVTNMANKTDQSKNLTKDNSEKWDVTNIMTTHRHDSDASDTFTDEETLNLTVKELQKKEESKKNSELDKENTQNLLLKDKFSKATKVNGTHKEVVSKDFSLLITRIDDNHGPPPIENIFKKPPMKSNNCRNFLEELPLNLDLHPIKNFWDTDFESDAECMPSPKLGNGYARENTASSKTSGKQQKDSHKKQGLFSVFNYKNPAPGSNTLQNFTLDNTQKFNPSTLKIKSHRAPTRNKFDRTDQNTISTLCEPQFTKQKDHSPKLIVKQSNKQLKDTPNKDKTRKVKKQVMKKKTPESAKKTNTVNDNTKKQSGKVLNDDKVTPATESNNNIKRCPGRSRKSNTIKDDKQSKEASKVGKNDKNKDEPQASKAKTPNKKNPKTKKAAMSLTNNDSTLPEENNNRPMRTCRLHKSNISTVSNVSSNSTANRTLRSRRANVSIYENLNENKNVKKLNNTKGPKTRLGNVSLSLSVDENAVPKRSLKKATNFSIFKADESDISFSLQDLSYSPRLTRSNSIIKNNIKKSTFNSSSMKDCSFLKNKSLRTRVPNKRYLN